MGVAATLSGLSESEAARRRAAKPPAPPPATRSYSSIVRANVFTLFNLILLVFGVLTLAFGKPQDALFLSVLIGNAAIGITQEIRAKRALDRLSALVAPTATVVRDGNVRTVAVNHVVEGDLVRLQPGDQVVGDGTLVEADGLLLDESILTGESDPVARAAGDEIRSGSFAFEGTGAYSVEAVGSESYAARITGEARSFRHPRSPLERAMNRLLLILVAVMVPLGAMFGYALWRRNISFSEAVTTSVAAVGTLVPEGLILLTSLTFAVAAFRMAKRGALAQQLNAIESLAAVDVICLDKTGTLTRPGLDVAELVPAVGVEHEDLEQALGLYAASVGSRNRTVAAIASAFPAEPARVDAEVPFSSRRRWSAARIEGVAYVLGGPDVLSVDGLGGAAGERARAGRRVLAFGTTEVDVFGSENGTEPPRSFRPLGLVVLAEQLRDEARETVDFFRREGVELKVISGDNPVTVAAVAADAGIEEPEPLDGRELPASRVELLRAVDGHAVIGRISPEGKRSVIEALRADGRYVAMVGDGVNDVPALKVSRLAIAQGSGVEMAKSVSDLVLVNGDFAAVPQLVGEGRKVLRNLQRVTKLFVAKSVFAAFLIVTIGLTPTEYPFLPRHITLAGTLTVGIPAFFLALGPSSGSFTTRGFLREVASWAVPAGTATGLGVVASYLFALNVVRFSVIVSQTVAVTVLVLVGLFLILALEASGRRRTTAVSVLVGGLLALYAVVLALPATRDFFQLAVPGPAAILISLLGAGVAIAGLAVSSDSFVPGRRAT
ncbi:MAG TPA: HAD-IC family P-type ATPase [Gaiellaceae bacterium]